MKQQTASALKLYFSTYGGDDGLEGRYPEFVPILDYNVQKNRIAAIKTLLAKHERKAGLDGSNLISLLGDVYPEVKECNFETATKAKSFFESGGFSLILSEAQGRSPRLLLHSPILGNISVEALNFEARGRFNDLGELGLRPEGVFTSEDSELYEAGLREHITKAYLIDSFVSQTADGLRTIAIKALKSLDALSLEKLHQIICAYSPISLVGPKKTSTIMPPHVNAAIKNASLSGSLIEYDRATGSAMMKWNWFVPKKVVVNTEVDGAEFAPSLSRGLSDMGFTVEGLLAKLQQLALFNGAKNGLTTKQSKDGIVKSELEVHIPVLVDLETVSAAANNASAIQHGLDDYFSSQTKIDFDRIAIVSNQGLKGGGSRPPRMMGMSIRKKLAIKHGVAVEEFEEAFRNKITQPVVDHLHQGTRMPGETVYNAVGYAGDRILFLAFVVDEASDSIQPLTAFEPEGSSLRKRLMGVGLSEFEARKIELEHKESRKGRRRAA